MSDKWKGRDKPDLDHLMNLFSDNIMSAFVRGHLIVETLLVQMIDLKLKNPKRINAFNLSFWTLDKTRVICVIFTQITD